MRKFLGLLAAAVIVTAASTAAFAQNVFRAEISFAAESTNFHVTMRQMSGNVPAPTDQSTNTVNWVNAFGTPTIGAAAWVNSRTYVAFNNDIELVEGAVVKFYTDNANGTDYKFAVGISTTNMNAMAAKKGNNFVNEMALPISYKVIHAADSAYAASVGDYAMGPDGSGAFGFGVWAVLDKSQAAYTATPEYSTIATDQGIRLGYGDGGVIFYDFKPDTYMFFSSSFYFAKRAHKYGTDKLTFEVVNP